MAFLLEPADSLAGEAVALATWVRAQHEEGRRVVVFNSGGASYVPEIGQHDARRIAAVYAAELTSLLTHRADVAIAVVAHDHRDGVGEHELLRSLDSQIDLTVRDRAKALITPHLRAREVKRLVADVDLVCTGRMHLAVAALGVGTPVVSISYQAKFAGLYGHFGLDPLSVTHDESLQPGVLEALVSEGLDGADRLRADIRRVLPDVLALASVNLGERHRNLGRSRVHRSVGPGDGTC